MTRHPTHPTKRSKHYDVTMFQSNLWYPVPLFSQRKNLCDFFCQPKERNRRHRVLLAVRRMRNRIQHQRERRRRGDARSLRTRQCCSRANLRTNRTLESESPSAIPRLRQRSSMLPCPPTRGRSPQPSYLPFPCAPITSFIRSVVSAATSKVSMLISTTTPALCSGTTMISVLVPC